MKISDSYLSELGIGETVNLNIKWGWFLTVGLVFLALGLWAFGNLVLATSISIFYVGIIMAVGGLMQLMHTFQVRTWPGFLYYAFSGFLYLAAGVIAFKNPMLAAASLTLYLAVTLTFSGAVRIWLSLQIREHYGWSWMLTSGLLTLLAGAVFAVDWPLNSIWLLGILLAVDLTFQGAATIVLSLSLKKSKQTTYGILQ
jgi:uncharacterized membrane protein HdeD (DUF308 family)